MRIKLLTLVVCLLSNIVHAELVIGVSGPFTGAYAAFGDQLLRGAELAIEHANMKGGADGQPILLVQADDACEPKQAVAVANRLVDLDEVDAVVGHFCSSSTIPASNVYYDADILMITPASTNPEVTDRGLPTVLRMCGRDDQQGVVAARFLSKTLGLDRIAVIHDKDTYGKGLADAMVASLNKEGVQPVLYEGLTRGEKDFNALVTKIKDEDAEALFFGGLHTEAGPLVRQLRDLGLEIPFMAGDGIMSEDFVTAAGGPDIVNGIYMTFGRDPRSLESGKNIVQAFRAKGYEPEGYTLYSYASVQAIIDAYLNGDAMGGMEMGQWLKENPTSTVMGKKAWNSHGDLNDSDYIVYQWNDKGEYQPFDIRQRTAS